MTTEEPSTGGGTATIEPTATPTEFPPIPLVSPSFKIGIAPDLHELKCAANQFSHGVDQDTNDYDTFCGSYRVYGVERQTFTVTLYQNFDDGGPWSVLFPLRNTVADFEFTFDDRIPVSPQNPKMTGKVRVPTMPMVDAAVNEASEIEMELAIQGAPTFVTTP